MTFLMHFDLTCSLQPHSLQLQSYSLAVTWYCSLTVTRVYSLQSGGQLQAQSYSLDYHRDCSHPFEDYGPALVFAERV